jgi:hypothetical protein
MALSGPHPALSRRERENRGYRCWYRRDFPLFLPPGENGGMRRDSIPSLPPASSAKKAENDGKMQSPRREGQAEYGFVIAL